MKKIYIILCLLPFAAFNTHAQVSGYMGHRFMFGLNLGYSPNLSIFAEGPEYALNADGTTFNYFRVLPSVGLQMGYVTGRHWSLIAESGFQYMPVTNEFPYNYNASKIPPPDYNTCTILSGKLKIQHQSMHQAPLGIYYGAHIFLSEISSQILFKNGDVVNAPSCNMFGIGISTGVRRVKKDRIYFELGFELNRTFQLSNSNVSYVTDLYISIDNMDELKDYSASTSAEKYKWNNFLAGKLAVGILL